MPMKAGSFMILSNEASISGCGEFIPILRRMTIRPGYMDIFDS
jgi:hypothetical protein